MSSPQNEKSTSDNRCILAKNCENEKSVREHAIDKLMAELEKGEQAIANPNDWISQEDLLDELGMARNEKNLEDK